MRRTGRVPANGRTSPSTAQPATRSSPRLSNTTVRRLAVQRQLTVGAANDPAEREADRMASHVMRELNRPAEPQRASIDEEELAMKRDPLAIRRESMEEEELAMKRDPSMARRAGPDEEELMQGKREPSPAVGMEGGPLDSATSSEISSARGSGQPLADNLRGPMESAFNADLSAVKVHTDSRSDALNSQLQAKAFTVGNDIFFRKGDYQPGSNAGQELLAHELTHVIQQGGG